MGVIFERELKALLRNIRAVLCIAAMALISALFFVVNDLSAGYSGMQSVFSNMSLVAALLIPPVATVAISAERKRGTDAILDAMPVTVWQIVFGKFLATLTFFLIPTAVIAIYPLILSALGGAPAVQGYLMLLVFVTFEAFLVALCLMISAFFKKSWVAVVVSYAIIAVSFILGLISALFNGVFKDVLRFVSPFRRFDPTVFDLLDLASLFFFLSLTALFLWFAATYYKKNKSVSEKARARARKNAITAGALATIILLANIAVYALPSNFRQLDISADGVYFVSDMTKNYLEELDDEITVYLIDPVTSEEKLHTFIRRYCELSDNITLKEVYTSQNEEFLEKYGMTSQPTYYSVIVESKSTGRWKLVSADEYFNYFNESYGYMAADEYENAVIYYTQIYSYYSQNPSGAEDYISAAQEALYSLTYETSLHIDAEAAISTAIEYVSAPKVPTLYFACGHGEKDTEANPLNIGEKGGIPEDAALIVINDPDTDYSAKEISLLEEYSQNGGKLLVMTDESVHEKANLLRLLSCFGLSAEKLSDGNVKASVNMENGALKDMPFEDINLTGASSIITSDSPDTVYSKLMTVGEQTVAVSVTEDSVKKLIWLTGADSFNRDTTNMSDSEKEEYTKAAYCVQGSAGWLWVPFASQLKFANPNEYEPTPLIVESGSVALIGVVFIGVIPLAMVGGAWINVYIRKKRSRAFKTTE